MSTDAALTITEFLLARIAEDEAVAHACKSEAWVITEGDGRSGPPWITGLNIAAADSTWDACIAVADATHATRHDPARVLAECAAKRAIISYFELEAEKMADPRKRQAASEPEWWLMRAAETTLQSLAAIYADHPHYQQKWTINGAR